MLRWISPHTPELLDPPRTESDRTRWQLSIILRALSLLLRVMVIVAAVYAFFLIDDWVYDGRFYISGQAVIPVFFFSVLVMLYADFAGIRAGIRVMHDRLRAFADDDLSDTPEDVELPTANHKLDTAFLQETDLYRRLHPLALAHTWRLTMLLTGLRLTVVILAALELREQLLPGMPLAAAVHQALETTPILLILPVGFALAAALVYLVEPWGRMQATTAFGLWTALRNRDSEDPVYLTGNFWWLAYWVLLYGMLVAALTLSNAIDLPPASLTFRMILTGGGLVGGATAALAAYHLIMRRRYLDTAAARLAQPQLILERISQLQQEPTRSIRSGVRSMVWWQNGIWQRVFTWAALIRMMRSDNPLFVMEARKLKRGGTLVGLRHWTVEIFRRVVIVVALLSVVSILLWIYNYVSYSSTYSYSSYTPNPFYLMMLNLLAMGCIGLGMISIVSSVILDFSCINAGLNAINRDMLDGRWDTLRLTMLTERQILTAKHAVTQIRAWRGLIWIFALRLISVVMGALLLVMPDSYDGHLPVRDVFAEFSHRPLPTTFIAITLFIFLMVYLLEPFWRHQAMTAVGLAVSAGRSTTNGLLAGMGAILGVWISQGIVIYVLVMIAAMFNSIAFAIFRRYMGDYDLMYYVQTLLLLLACIGTGLVIFIYYTFLQRLNLRIMRERSFTG